MSTNDSQLPTRIEEEVWKDIKGYEGYYQVSDHGRIKSLYRKIIRSDGVIRTIPEKMRSLGKKGHQIVNLRRSGKEEIPLVHRLVLEAFVGPCPPGMECCHNDGNPQNNWIGNLRWDTHINNMRDKIKHGTSKGRIEHIKGEDSKWAKLTEEQARAALDLWKTGKYSKAAIGRILKVHRDTVIAIIVGFSWKHLPRD